ncbi:MAG TPA: aminotransferase class V-fold PLP-dependent enzyme [Candidatus Acidoferrales bacterium]|nr:aminotransferase class V-fold PLP-dependent enzyme [Candidatus Acidoferrales bacterium]
MSNFATDDDVARWRADTPGCERSVHLNNAGAGLMTRIVLDVMKTHLDAEALDGGYEAAQDNAPRIAAAYESVARLCGTAAHNVAFIENATAGVALILSAFAWKPGDRIVTTLNDYASNQIMMLSLAQRYGVEILRARDLDEGGADPDDFARLLASDRVKLALVTWVPTNSGLIQPVAELGARCVAAGVPYAIDACQAAGQLPIDVTGLRCDYLTASARKFLRGPRGIGFLYASERVLNAGYHPLFADMRGADWTHRDAFELKPDARRFENWEFAYALVLGMGAAADYALAAGQDRTSARARALAANLREGLAAIPGVRLLDRGRELAAIVSFEPGAAEPAAVVKRLRERGINASWTPRTSATIDLEEKGAAAIVRLSPHYYNTEAEIGRAVEEVARIL